MSLKVSMSRDFTGHLNSEERSKYKDRRKTVFVVGDSMLWALIEGGNSMQYSVQVRNLPGATAETINKEVHDIFQ